jgi:hypothetical protein
MYENMHINTHIQHAVNHQYLVRDSSRTATNQQLPNRFTNINTYYYYHHHHHHHLLHFDLSRCFRSVRVHRNQPTSDAIAMRQCAMEERAMIDVVFFCDSIINSNHNLTSTIRLIAKYHTTHPSTSTTTATATCKQLRLVVQQLLPHRYEPATTSMNSPGGALNKKLFTIWTISSGVTSAMLCRTGSDLT